MKNYTRINPVFARKGDIVIVNKATHIDYPGDLWSRHFVYLPTRYILNDTPSNNGNVSCKNLLSAFHWINVIVDKNIIGIYRKNDKNIQPYEIERS